MSSLKPSTGKAVAGTAFLVAFLAAMIGATGSASAASAVCTFDKEPVVSTLEFWKEAWETQEALSGQPLHPHEGTDLYWFYEGRWLDDDELLSAWTRNTGRDLNEAWDRAIRQAEKDYLRARGRVIKKANRWLRRNKARLGEERALDMAWAMYRRAHRPLRKQKAARNKKTRTVCSKALRQVEPIGRSAEREVYRSFGRTADALDVRVDLWWEQNPYGDQSFESKYPVNR